MLLPSAEADKVTASLSDGVLTMTVPRSEAEKSHRVEVTSGRAGPAGTLPTQYPAACPPALIEAIGQLARRQGCTRLWVITTNDNVDALRFYQRRGFCLVRVHRGAVDGSRASLKPEIPPVGAYGIPLRDEIELERQP